MLKLLILFLSLNTFAKYPLSDHYNGEEFFNPGHHELKSFWQVIKWKAITDPVPWPEFVANKSYPFTPFHPDQKAKVTFINHATFLLQFDNLTVLTDPIFSKRASPVSFAGPKRVREPGLSWDQLPPVDVVIISHNHYDHLDLASLKNLDQKYHPLFLVPLGDEALLKKSDIQNVREMDWWQDQKVKEYIITFTPAQHWSARGLFDKCESLWGSFYISGNEFKVYFGGDTGYAGHFNNIRLKLGSPDLALLPIGAYEPRWFMKFSHMNPEDAVLAHKDLAPGLSIGMHFGTFQLTDEGINDPLDALKKVAPQNFVTLDQGESRDF
jgi:L-ascorbate metabolism protein UlaG (beta-lactamase superfamily)